MKLFPILHPISDSPAYFTLPHILICISVFFCIFMALWAMRNGKSLSFAIFGTSDFFDMIWINAISISANMINFITSRNWIFKKFKRPTMCQHVFFTIPKHPISSIVFRADPFPAIFIDYKKRIKSFLHRFLFKRLYDSNSPKTIIMFMAVTSGFNWIFTFFNCAFLHKIILPYDLG